MKFDYQINAVDTHTGGTPTRIIYDPLLFGIAGKSMAEKQANTKERFDFIRKALICEPRGYMAMSGAIVTAPVSQSADFGLLFLDTAGYFNLCAHAIVGVATAAAELGWVQPECSQIIFDTMTGLVSVSVEKSQGKVTSATMKDAPSFYFGDVEFDLEGRSFKAQIAYCANIYALLDASDFDLAPAADQAAEWSRLALSIRDQLNRNPALLELTSGREVKIVSFSAPPENPKADYRSIVMFGDGQIDREPCGTCTCAKMAVLFEKGELDVGQSFLQESILSTYAKACIVDTTEVENHHAIIAEVSYMVYLTGLHSYLIDNDDSLREGYLLPA